MDRIVIRKSVPEDRPSIEHLYPMAFPDEDLLPVVRTLLDDAVRVHSMVATLDGKVLAHIAFTLCGVDEAPNVAALLAPLAVAPDVQRQGLGRALIQDGLARMADAGAEIVLVLGDPAYYGRSGFAEERDIAPTYPLPDEWRGAWQSIRLDTSGTPLAGTLKVPPVWNDPALWGP